MNKNLQKAFYFFFWWNILLLFRAVPLLTYFVRFSFVFVLISAFYLFKEVYINKTYKYNPIPKGYKFIIALLLIWVFVNIFRAPPGNPKGLIRFLGGKYYVAAWYPILFVYIGSKRKYWSQIWHYAIKFNKLLVITSPIIFILFFSNSIWWVPLSVLFFLIPLLIVNWTILLPKEKKYLLLGFFIAVFITFAGGSRGLTLRFLYYIPVLLWITVVRKQKNKGIQIFQMFGLFVLVMLSSYFVYNFNVSSYFTGDIKENVLKFEGKNFKNSRELYVYPDFFADMKTTKDWVLGRGINGTYFSPIFVNQMKDLDPDRKSTRLNSSHIPLSRMPSSA